MFTNDVSHATATVYSSNLEDFQQNDAAQLDRWVFKEVEVSYCTVFFVNFHFYLEIQACYDSGEVKVSV